MSRRESGSAIISAIVLLALGLSIALALFVVLAVAVPLPAPETPLASMLYGQDNEVFGKLFVENRTEIPFSQMPPRLREAVVAIEDTRFYKHPGIDPIAIARALVVDIRRGRIVEGGSTITQQLAKNLYLTFEKTLTRKAIEALLTVKLELKYTKNEILAMYLNQIYFGAGSYGVEAASMTYFGRPARDLDLPKAALLAGIIRSPEAYSPFTSPDLARRRRDTVLQSMKDLGYITEAEQKTASATSLGTRPKPQPLNEAPYFADYVVEQIKKEDPSLAEGLHRGGYRIYTTLNVRMQQAAEKALAGMKTATTDASGVTQPQVALVALDPSNGQIRAMAGGRNYANTPLNRVIQAHRQPGSAFKPFVYAAALDRGYAPTSTSMCEPVSYPGPTPDRPYQPTDYGTEKYHYRPLAMREAIAVSDNVVAVRWAQELGPSTVASYARRMGIQSPLGENLSLALGSSEVTPLELASAYATIANLGYRIEPVGLLRVEDRWGRVVLQRRARAPVRVLDEGVAYVLTDLMKSVTSPGGTAGFIRDTLQRPVAGKTGTTDEYRDAWFAGFTRDMVAVVYVGYDHKEKAVGSGGSVAAPLWAEFASRALEGTQVAEFRRPSSVVEAWICTETGLLANPACPARAELFTGGTEPTQVCPLPHFEQPIPRAFPPGRR